MRAAHAYQDIPFEWPVHMVMGLPVSPGLTGLIDKIIPAVSKWRKLYNKAVKRQCKGIKRAVKAGVPLADIRAWFGRALEPLGFGIYGIESLRSGEGWFVHAHQLIECSWVNKALAEACWREATSGAAWIAKVRRVGDKHSPNGGAKRAVYEVCKYISKGLSGGGHGLSDKDLSTLYHATFNRRLIGAWGLDRSWVHTKEITFRFACECGGKLLPTGERLSFAQAFEGLYHGVLSVLRLDSS